MGDDASRGGNTVLEKGSEIPDGRGWLWRRRYLVAIVAAAAALLLRAAFTPLIGGTGLAFTFFFPAILIVAWVGGFRAAMLCILVSALAADWMFTPPIGSLWIHQRAEVLDLAVFLLVGFGIAVLAHSQRRARVAMQRSLRALQESNAAFARANEDLNQFAFAASHDLQEPLRMVTSYSQLLARNYPQPLEGEAAWCVEAITAGTERMHRLLADLLAYAQLGGGGQPARAVDLNAVFDGVTDNLKIAIADSAAVVTNAGLPVVHGHEPHFAQLLQNLMGNALKYRSGDPPRVRVSAARQEGEWRFAVADNGLGIDARYHEMIFGLFKRAHGESQPGSGMGLAICRRVVERYGGRIWVESQPGRGATFFFTLPDGASPGGAGP